MKSTRLTLAVAAEDLDHLQTVLNRNPLASRHSIAVAALRSGLDRMYQDQGHAEARLLAEARRLHGDRLAEPGV